MRGFEINPGKLFHFYPLSISVIYVRIELRPVNLTLQLLLFNIDIASMEITREASDSFIRNLKGLFWLGLVTYGLSTIPHRIITPHVIAFKRDDMSLPK